MLRLCYRQVGAVLLLGGLSACASYPEPPVYTPAGPAMAGGSDAVDPDAPPRLADGLAPMECVPYARQASGIQIFGDASTWWDQAAGRYPRSSLPAPGAVLVMRGYNDPTRGHVAVVTAVVSTRVIRVDQANWLNHGEISLSVPVMDVSPNNDWSQVRVWYIPTQDWGARVYQAQGFIHPFALAPGV